MELIRVLIVFAGLIVGCQAGYAHPHVFINTDITVCFDSVGIGRLRIAFSFDKIFSTDLKNNFDADQNNVFSDEEEKEIKEYAFSNLVNFNYFIHAVAKKKELTFSGVSDFYAYVKGDVVVYSFVLVPNIAVGKEVQTIKIAPYDHSYFIDVSLNKENLKFENAGGYTYSYKVIDDKQMAYYYDQVFPDCVVLNVSKN